MLQKYSTGNAYILPIYNETSSDITDFFILYSTGIERYDYTLIGGVDNSRSFHLLQRYFNAEIISARTGGINPSEIYVDIESVFSYKKNCTPIYTVYAVYTDWYQVVANITTFLGTTFHGFEVEVSGFYCDNGQGGPSPGPGTTIVSSTGDGTVTSPPQQSFDLCVTNDNLWQGPYDSEASINFQNWDLTFDLYDASIQGFTNYHLSLNLSLSFAYLPDMLVYRDLTAQAVNAAFKDAHYAAYGTVMYTLGNNTTLSRHQMQAEIESVFTSSFESFIRSYIGQLDPTVNTASVQVSNNLDPNTNSFDPNNCL